MPCLVLSCLVLSCLVLSCLVVSCRVLSCLVLSCLPPYRPARAAAGRGRTGRAAASSTRSRSACSAAAPAPGRRTAPAEKTPPLFSQLCFHWLSRACLAKLVVAMSYVKMAQKRRRPLCQNGSEKAATTCPHRERVHVRVLGITLHILRERKTPFSFDGSSSGISLSRACLGKSLRVLNFISRQFSGNLNFSEN